MMAVIMDQQHIDFDSWQLRFNYILRSICAMAPAESTMVFGLAVYINSVTHSVTFGFGEFVGGFQSLQNSQSNLRITFLWSLPTTY